MDRNAYVFDVENDIITIIAQGRRDEMSAQEASDSVLAYRRYIAAGPTEGRKLILDFIFVSEVPERAVDAIVAAHQKLNFTSMAVVRHNNWQATFIDMVIAKTGKTDQYRTFENIEDARAWLTRTTVDKASP